MVSTLVQPQSSSAQDARCLLRGHLHPQGDAHRPPTGRSKPALIYLAISRKLIEGAPVNSIYTVPVMA